MFICVNLVSLPLNFLVIFLYQYVMCMLQKQTKNTLAMMKTVKMEKRSIPNSCLNIETLRKDKQMTCMLFDLNCQIFHISYIVWMHVLIAMCSLNFWHQGKKEWTTWCQRWLLESRKIFWKVSWYASCFNHSCGRANSEWIGKKPWIHFLGLFCAAFNKESASKCFLLFHRWMLS